LLIGEENHIRNRLIRFFNIRATFLTESSLPLIAYDTESPCTRSG
jgi:hypothetical protein